VDRAREAEADEHADRVGDADDVGRSVAREERAVAEQAMQVASTTAIRSEMTSRRTIM
jgi:hypothetical protein